MSKLINCMNCGCPHNAASLLFISGPHLGICEKCRKEKLEAYWKDQGKTCQVEFTKRELETIGDALADINCWLDGFLAGKGSYEPDSQKQLKDLRIKLRDALQPLLN